MRNTPGALNPLWVSRIEEMVRAGVLPHRIAEQLDVHVSTVRKHSAAVREQMSADGIACACGRPLGHRYWCSAKWDAFDQPRGRRPLPEPRETIAVEALLRGEVVADIARAAGVGPTSIFSLRRSLSADQLASRTAAIRKRIALGAGLQAEEIMRRVKAAVPRGIDRAVRDDIEAELCLAVVEGRIEVEQIKAAVRSFVSRGLTEWQSAYGPASLDAPVGRDDDRTRGALIADAATEAAIDEIVIGGSSEVRCTKLRAG